MYVIDIANPFVPALSIEAPLSKAITLFAQTGWRTLPVIENGIFKGILEQQLPLNTSENGLTVRQFYTRSTIFLSPSDTVCLAAEILSYKILEAIPVVDVHGVLIGIVTERELPPAHYEQPSKTF